jgi:hypothetical protein
MIVTRVFRRARISLLSKHSGHKLTRLLFVRMYFPEDPYVVMFRRVTSVSSTVRPQS